MRTRPELLTFDIFGTVLDWRTGLGEACHAAGRPLRDGEFDRVIDVQGALEQGSYLDYATIVRRSLVDVLSLPESTASSIEAGLGGWPFYPDVAVLDDLMRIAPCVAMTNSDHSHGEALQARLGFRLSDWFCAEEARTYKPDPGFWQQVRRRRGIEPGPHWWHVSAYADYDLEAARDLGLTTVFVQRPHARQGPASCTVRDLGGLLALVGGIQQDCQGG